MSDVADFIAKNSQSLSFFATKTLRANPTAQQRSVLEAIDSGKSRIAVKSGHGTGKTTLLSWIILWTGLFRKGAKIPCTAPAYPQLAAMLAPEVRKWRHVLPIELRELIDMSEGRVSFRHLGNEAIFRTARPENPEALQGFHADYLCWIVDEASGVSEKHFEAIEGSLTGEKSLVILTGNPTRITGFFYDAFTRNSDLWERFTFNAENSENVTKASIELKRREYGEDSDAYRVRVLGEFPRQNADALFSQELIYAAQSLDSYSDEGADIWALDVARYGDDKSVLCKRRDRNIYALDKRRSMDTQELAGWLAHEYREATNKPQAIYIDVIGVGAGVYDRALALNLPVFEANVSIRADDDQTYFNKRSEIFHRLRDALKNGTRLINDDELTGDLTAIAYVFKSGKAALEEKSETKKKLGRSPDSADAVALTYFSAFMGAARENYNYDDYAEGIAW
jgi:hypothetical protein